MSFSIGQNEAEDEVVSAINTTPLVDVMLVLLIIFLITIPVVAHTIPVKLPSERNRPTVTKPENIVIAITKDGDLFWDRIQVPDASTLLAKLEKVAVENPQPEVHIRGDKNARYEYIGRVVFACQRAGIVKVGFIIEPLARGG